MFFSLHFHGGRSAIHADGLGGRRESSVRTQATSGQLCSNVTEVERTERELELQAGPTTLLLPPRGRQEANHGGDAPPRARGAEVAVSESGLQCTAGGESLPKTRNVPGTRRRSHRTDPPLSASCALQITSLFNR